MSSVINRPHFTEVEGYRIPKSKFDMSNSVSLTCNAGDLVPIEMWEVLPGDIYDISSNHLARLQTLLAPLMDDIYLDVFTFFVPNRLVWEHWREFMGENTKAKYYNKKDYFVPHIKGRVAPKSVADYLGVPPNVDNLSFNALPCRAYSLIWNEWFRSEALQDPILVDISDNNHSYDKNNPVYGGKLLKVNKYHDYFTSALPNLQAGEPVKIPMLASENIPVFTGETNSVIPKHALSMKRIDGQDYTGWNWLGTYSDSQNVEQYVRASQSSAPTGDKDVYVAPVNLWANIQGLPVTDINTLRLAFATQQFMERNNLGGNRYIEIVQNHFGVVSPDARLQRPELIGYSHNRVNISQVVQQSETNNTPLGDVAGLSVTYNSDDVVSKAFTEHGFIMVLASFRYKHTYQDGLSRELSRKNKFDYYFPVFANLGEQPILNKEIYATGTKTDDEVFGYQERWSEYRYKVNRLSGELRSSYKTPLDYWTLADKYKSMPYLSAEWLLEDKEPIDRAISVQSKLADQFILNFYFETEVTRLLPVYSVPGLKSL